MHLADAFIQSDLQCTQAIHLLSLYSSLLYAKYSLNSNSFMVLNIKNQSQCRFQLDLKLDFLL